VKIEPIEMIVVKGTAQSPRNTEADLVELLDGRLLLAWTEFYGGTCGDHDLARISGKTSDDRGRTWSDRFTVVDSEGAWNNCMEPDFQRLPSEELLLFYMHKNSRMDTRVFLRRSKDDGETWSERYPVSYDRGYHCTTNARSIRTSSGRLVLPVMLRGATGPLASYVNGTYFPTNEKVNGKPVFGKIGGADRCLYYAKDGTWCVSAILRKCADRVVGWAHTDVGLAHPSLAIRGAATLLQPAAPPHPGR